MRRITTTLLTLALAVLVAAAPAGAQTLSGKRRVIASGAGTVTLTTAQSGATFVNTATGTTTTFTLPSATTANIGLNYCFVENGDAAGELLLGVAAGDSIIGKTQPSETGTGISTAAGTGIKNTAATNVKGDFVCLIQSAALTWVMVSQAGVWASR